MVLSACNTALGVQRGDTTMDLPLGFFVGGTETVIASLWNVDDRGTALLMARVYSNWLGKRAAPREIDGVLYSPGQGMSKLAALREAKAWLRDLTIADLGRMIDAGQDINTTEVSRDPTRLRGRLQMKKSQHARPYEHPYYWAAFVLYGSSV